MEMNRFPLILCTAFLIACSSAPQTELNVEAKNDTLRVTQTKAQVNQLEFPKADTVLYSFFSQLEEVEKFVDPTIGVYCIESGPGVVPMIEKMKEKSDLLGKTPFLFMYRDVAFIKNNVSINPQNFDVCAVEDEGYFIFDLAKPQTILEDICTIYKNQQLDLPSGIVPEELKSVDGLVQKCVVVNFKDKGGDQNLITLYFCIKNNTPYLYIVDLRECGV